MPLKHHTDTRNEYVFCQYTPKESKTLFIFSTAHGPTAHYFYYLLAISVANFPAFIPSFYQRSKKQKINGIKILLFTNTN